MVTALIVTAQQSSNPFDLKYRPSKPSTSTATTTKIVPPVGVDTTVITPPISSEKPISNRTDTLNPLDTNKIAGNPFELHDDAPLDSSNVSLETLVDETDSNKVAPFVERRKPSRGIQIFLLLLSLLFLIFIVNVERNFVKDLWRVISNENYSSLHLRNQRNTMRQILLLMGYLVFILQGGIFLYHALVNFQYQDDLFDNIGTCIALIFIIYLVRHVVIRYLRWLFNNEKEMTLYSFDISTFNIMVGLVLLPINVMLNFGPESLFKPLIIIGLIAILGAYALRQLRWMLTARHLIANSLFLFFVYLCAVEILPLWAVSKFFW